MISDLSYLFPSLAVTFLRPSTHELRLPVRAWVCAWRRIAAPGAFPADYSMGIFPTTAQSPVFQHVLASIPDTLEHIARLPMSDAKHLLNKLG